MWRVGARWVLAWGLALCLWHPSAGAQSEQEEGEGGEVDHVELASLMVQHGHYDRAYKVLSQVDPSSPQVALGRYHSLRGLVWLKRGELEEAARSLEAALSLGEPREPISLLLAQTYFGLGRWGEALESLEGAGASGRESAGAWVLRVQAHWRLGSWGEAWEASRRGVELHPRDLEVARQDVLLHVELGLLSPLRQRAERFLGLEGVKAQDALALAEALRRARRFEEALVWLEVAGLRFPGEAKLGGLLARTLADADRPLSAAQLYGRLAMREPAYAADAAETYRRAGWMWSALRMNARVPDAKTRLRQRLGLLLEVQDYEQAAALLPRLKRLGLLSEDPLAYGAAYALFQVRRYEAAESCLEGISDPGVFSQSVELRRAMEVCRQDPRSCG